MKTQSRRKKLPVQKPKMRRRIKQMPSDGDMVRQPDGTYRVMIPVALRQKLKTFAKATNIPFEDTADVLVQAMFALIRGDRKPLERIRRQIAARKKIRG